jgi:hypothetical protein
MQTISVSSSAIRSVAYDPESRRLYISFHSGGPYTFYRVPREIYVGLINATSPGTYYHRHIAGRYT